MRKTIDVTKKPSQEQIEMLAKAATLPIYAESEYPEFSETELLQFKRITDAVGRQGKNKYNVYKRRAKDDIME